jgi:hypothetical protein
MSLNTNSQYRSILLEGAPTFVQDENFSFPQQCPGKANKLSLSSRKRRSTLSNGRIKPLGKTFHVFLQVGLFHRMISMTTPHTSFKTCLPVRLPPICRHLGIHRRDRYSRARSPQTSPVIAGQLSLLNVSHGVRSW